MLTGISGEANAANDLAVLDEGNAAFNRYGTFQPKYAETYPTSSQGVLKGLGRTLEQRRRAGFVNGDLSATELGIVHLLVIDEVTAGVDNRNRHVPVVLASLGEGCCRRLLRCFQAYRRTVRCEIRVGGGLLRQPAGYAAHYGNNHQRL